MNDKDLQIENILKDAKDTQIKNKVDGKAKGNRTELNLCKLLTTHFKVDFVRSVGSGNRWGQVNLNEQAKQVFTGDICVPEKFKWVIESKGGYEDIDLANGIDGTGIPFLEEFIEQVSKDAIYCKRKPIVCWKRNRKPWLAMIKFVDIIEHIDSSKLFDIFPYRLHYNNWIMVSLKELLNNTNEDFWFKK